MNNSNNNEKILILDFGSQVTQLIARRVRESGVYSEIFPYTKWEEGLKKICLLYTSPSPRDLSTSRMPSSA